MKCQIFKKEYLIENDSKLIIELEYGETKFQSIKDINLLYSELNIPICGVLSESFTDEIDNPKYQHCDGRITNYNQIPENELFEWSRMKLKLCITTPIK